jgi:AcrR family transcriptional regulator
MFTQMKKRKYTKTLRAEQQEETRNRIIDALIELHQELGPANTTVKAVAEKAGVQRLTVYRHFPDETSMLQACTSHWLDSNPPPTSDAWDDIPDPLERCYAALLAFYRYYRHTEGMWAASYRDVEKVQALQAPMTEFETYLDQVALAIVKPWKTNKATKDRLKITLRHALHFLTWQSLRRQKLNDEKMAKLISAWLNGVTDGEHKR